jgi:hypothetical protein
LNELEQAKSCGAVLFTITTLTWRNIVPLGLVVKKTNERQINAVLRTVLGDHLGKTTIFQKGL